MGIWPDLEERHPNIAYLYALVGNISLSLMQIFFKFLTAVVSPLHILFLRAFTLLCFNTLILQHKNKSPHVNQPKVFKLVMIRTLTTSLASSLLHFSFKYLPLSTASTLFNLNPIIVYFLESIYFKKPFDKLKLLLTIICFSGVVLVIQPDFLFGSEIDRVKIQNFQILSGMVIVSAVLVGIGFIVMHDMAKSIDSFVNLHYTYMGHMLITSTSAIFHAPVIEFSSFSFFYVCMMLGVLFFGWASQLFIYESSRLKKPSLVFPFCYVAIIVSFCADVFLFDIQFGWLSIFGMVLTSSGLLGKFLIQKFQNPHQVEKISTNQLK